MINFNQNLYTTQWLDLVFQNRNKSYGAYELRKHNNETTAKAFAYASILFAGLIVFAWIYGQIGQTIPPVPTAQTPDPVEVSLAKIQEEKPLIPPPAQAARQKPLQSIQYTTMVVAPPAADNIEPPSRLDISQSVISTITASGTDATGINHLEQPAGVPGGTGTAETVSENTIYSLDAIEKYPEFPGGQEAFAKYLSRHLRYPGMAAEHGIQGKVLVSFIIERNGELSHIKILRSIGGGCDEEAMRVLAKSPKWAPGLQNNQSVRVAYNIPINFKLPD
ncbi:MAG: TonB family protein [Daejeonella sp.]|uniref:energy transducer TonB n=1 Tax=Daejeonella sp. JGW-45 TaxID=3034148 RepID=UPI0023EDC94B|nr:energy transducer TonB [Daejeonella sp. JGW-45]